MRKGSNPNQCSRERLARVFGNMVPRQILIAILLSCFAIAQPPSRIQSIVTAGSLDSMRWRNFSDYRVWLQKFYELVGYAPAWLQGNAPSSQALVMIERFRDAAQNGLEPEDYDASRWNDRVQWPFARLERVGMILFECEKRAAVLQHESGSGRHQT